MDQIRDVDQFECRGDSGQLYTLVVRQKIMNRMDLDGTRTTTSGLKDIITIDGKPVNQLDDKRYQMVLTEEILWKI